MIKKFYIAFIVAAGIVGGLLRASCILTGLEEETGLPAKGMVSFYALVALCVIVFGVSVLLSRSLYGEKKDWMVETLIGSQNKAARLGAALCGVVITAVGVTAFLSIGAMVAEQTSDYQPMGVISLLGLYADFILCAVSGGMMVVFALRQDGREVTGRTGLFVTIPMFWMCADLIMTYHENSANPVMQDYSFELVQVIAFMAAFYFLASLYFSDARPVQMTAFLGFSVFMTLTCGLSGLASLFTAPQLLVLTMMSPTADLLRFGAHLMVGVYLFIQLTQLQCGETK